MSWIVNNQKVMSIQLQQQIKNNASDIRSYVKDLYQWQEQVNAKPVQTTSVTKQPEIPLKPDEKTEEFKKLKRDSNNVKDYYDAWNKFDVDHELEKADYGGKPFNPFQSAKGSVRAKPKTQLVVKNNRVKPVSDPTSLKDRGNIHFKSLQFQKALESYTECLNIIEQEKKDSNKQLLSIVYSNRAMTFIKLKEFAKAEEDCSKSLFYNPKFVKALCRRAMSRHSLKKLKLAIGDYQAALQIEPANKEIINQLNFLKGLQQKKIKEAHAKLVIPYCKLQDGIEIPVKDKRNQAKPSALDDIE